MSADPREAADRAATFKPGDRVLLPSGREGELVSRTGGVWSIRLAPGELLWPYRDANLIAAPSTPAAVQVSKPPARDIQIIERLDMFDVVEGSFLHMSFPFNPRSEASRDRTKARADGFKHGLLYEAALHAMGSSLADGPSLLAAPAPVGPAKDSEPILTWHANEGWSVLAKDGARFRLVPSSTPAAVQGGGEGLAEAVGKLSSYHNERAHYLRRSSKRSERERSSFHADACSTLRQAAFALRAAPAPVPEVSDDMVERACRVWVDLDAGQPSVWLLLDQEERQVRSNIMRAALTAALASASAQDREGDNGL